MKKTGCIVLACAALGVVAQANATVITYSFTGNILSYTQNQYADQYAGGGITNSPPPPSLLIGQTVTYSYSFDSNVSGSLAGGLLNFADNPATANATFQGGSLYRPGIPGFISDNASRSARAAPGLLGEPESLGGHYQQALGFIFSPTAAYYSTFDWLLQNAGASSLLADNLTGFPTQLNLADWSSSWDYTYTRQLYILPTVYSGLDAVYKWSGNFTSLAITCDGGACPEIPVSPVPEPGTVLLMGLGVGMLGIGRRRNNRHLAKNQK